MNSILTNIFKLFRKKEKANENQLSEGSSLRAIVVTDLGNVRKNNEDAGYFIRPNDPKIKETKGFLGIVADGMGGHASGEVASGLAIETIRSIYYESKEGIKESLLSAFNAANSIIYKQANNSSQNKGMGTTATAVVICQNRLHYAHVGDSRLYLLNQESIKQLSTDHTYVQQLLDTGEISKQEASNHPERNVLTQAMGTKASVKVETGSISSSFLKGDRLLLCSDGLYDYISDEEMSQMAATGELKSCAYNLLETAKTRGGHDNITIVLIESIEELERVNDKVTTDLEDLVKRREAATAEINLPPKTETE